MSKGNLASESLSFNKTGVCSAAERGLIPDRLKCMVCDCCILQLRNALLQIYACVCVFACPKWSSEYLFLTCNYFCPPFPVPGAVSCFIFQATDRKHFFSTAEEPGTVPRTWVGWLAEPWQTKGFVLLAPSCSSAAKAPHQKQAKVCLWATREIKGCGLKQEWWLIPVGDHFPPPFDIMNRIIKARLETPCSFSPRIFMMSLHKVLQ